MPRRAASKPNPSHPIRFPVCALALAIVALLVPAAAPAAQSAKVVAKKAPNATLGKTILTSTSGRTLYSLSAETNGKFICADAACLASWRPLVVAKGVVPKGPVSLGTVLRPDGRTQVSFKGRPLYTFNGDIKKGEANGEGIRDVGTWHAASTGKLAQPQPQPQPSSEQPYPY